MCFISVSFHIAHLYEVQGKYKLAKDQYEQLLNDSKTTIHLRADICRQLGKFVIEIFTLRYLFLQYIDLLINCE